MPTASCNNDDDDDDGARLKRTDSCPLYLNDRKREQGKKLHIAWQMEQKKIKNERIASKFITNLFCAVARVEKKYGEIDNGKSREKCE